MSHLLYQNHFRKALPAGHHGEHVLRLVGNEVHEYQSLLELECFLQRAFHIVRLFDFHADMAITLGQLDEIRQRIHIRFSIAIAVKELLPLPHHAHVAVVQINDLERQIILLAGGQLLDAHLDAGLAGDARDRALADSQTARPSPPADRSPCVPKPARIDPAARLVEFVKLRSPHLMLAHVRGNERIPLGDFIKLFNDQLRLDDWARAVVFEAIARPP